MFSETLAWEVQYRECNNDIGEPIAQLLTCIGKANAGVHDDNWRPLSVPTTYNRLLTGGVTDWITTEWKDAIDPNQSMVGDFKEAHANYCTAQNLFNNDATNNPGGNGDADFLSVLLTDLVKAFELLNPKRICAILRARNAPPWLQAIVNAFTGKCCAVAKIMGRLLKAVFVNIGVDMGNALAPWIFCLALDPIVRYSNRIPRVINMKAYMDDTNTTGKGRQWLLRTQAMWEAMYNAGLHIAKHTCMNIKIDGTLEQGASLSCIIRTASTRCGPAAQVEIAGETIPLHNTTNADGSVKAWLIRRALAQPCICKGVKSKLLLQRPPSDWILEQIDNTTYGCRIIAEKREPSDPPHTAPIVDDP